MKNLFINERALFLITDRTISNLSLAKMTEKAIRAGIKTIQLREKNMTKKELYKEALSIRKFTLKYRATFIINDYVDIALAVNADGVHLGQEDMPIKEARKLLGENKIIGISTHSLKQAVDAQRAGADYIAFGPIFKTTTKDAGSPKGIEFLIEIKKHIKIPVVAIGGILSFPLVGLVIPTCSESFLKRILDKPE
ncbi:MAG: thiamine phosphate synthase [Nitrospirae bacterium]|nr:thiamine phosphate synthase [Nitrospirota bacterium]